MDSRDYINFGFYKKNGYARNLFFTKRRYFKLIKSFDYETFNNLINKDYVNEHYSRFINRKWLKVTDSTDNDTINNFISSTPKVIVKPLSSEQGRGIFKVTNDMQSEIEKFCAERKGDYLLEECIENHPLIKAINPSSLNTIRVSTIVDNNEDVHILTTFLRVGNGNTDVDNWGAGGIGYHINADGIVDGYGVDKNYRKYSVHPSTNTQMIGFKMPMYHEMLDFCKDIISINKKAVFCGLDIAITPTGFSLVEINFPGSYELLQGIGEGFYPLIKQYRGIK